MKDEIIDIAVRQLRLGGYDNLNFAAIAAELGTTRANLHHHFKNKEGLGKAAVEKYIADEKEQIDLILQRYADDLDGFLTALEDHILKIVYGRPEDTACIGSQLIRDSVAPESLRQLVIDRFQAEAVDIEHMVIRHLQSKGQDDIEAGKTMAFRIVSTFHGLSLMGLITSDKDALARQIKGSMTFLAR